MKQLVSRAIVLSRTNFGEADRIISVLTPDSGKLRLLAKGVRKIKSRMAGGIELFSINDITYLQGRNEIGTLISSRLVSNFGYIVKDVDRTMYAYDVLKLINRITEESPDPDYYYLLANVLASLDSESDINLVKVWLNIQLLKIDGHMPNLVSDAEDNKLKADTNYMFSFDNMSFIEHHAGTYNSSHIKLLRLTASSEPIKISKVSGITKLLPPLVSLSTSMLSQYTKM